MNKQETLFGYSAFRDYYQSIGIWDETITRREYEKQRKCPKNASHN